MSHSDLDIIVRELAEANPTITAEFIEAIEDELEFFCEDMEDFDGNILRRDIWEHLHKNFDELFLDNGISVMTYEGPEFQAASQEHPALAKVAALTFSQNILKEALEELQQIIDTRCMSPEEVS